MQPVYSPDIVVILAFALVAGFILYHILKLYKKFQNRKEIKAEKVVQQKKRQASKDKDDALEKFKKIHASARDQRKKLAKAIAEDPEKTTATLRRMMKK